MLTVSVSWSSGVEKNNQDSEKSCDEMFSRV